MTAMRYICKTTNYNNMQEVFSIGLTDEYREANTHLNKLIRDPTLLHPGKKSIVLITPLNTGWHWVEERQNIDVLEVWSESSQMSELTRPISLDDMIEHFLNEMIDESVYANAENPNLRFAYHRSLRKVFTKMYNWTYIE